MPKLATTAARFVTREEHEEHGNIVCTNGIQLLCYSRGSALEGARILRKKGFITKGELPKLLEQIEQSPLPYDADLGPVLCIPVQGGGHNIYPVVDPWEELPLPAPANRSETMR